MHFLQRNAYISIKISLTLIPNGPISNTQAFVQIMVCRLVLDNGLAPNRRQPIIWTNADPIHWRVYAALEEDVLTLNCDDTVCSTNANLLLYLFCCHFLWINVKHFSIHMIVSLAVGKLNARPKMVKCPWKIWTKSTTSRTTTAQHKVQTVCILLIDILHCQFYHLITKWFFFYFCCRWDQSRF